MSRKSANRLPVRGDQVAVDADHRDHGGKKGIVLAEEGDHRIVKFNGTEATAIIEAWYLVVHHPLNLAWNPGFFGHAVAAFKEVKR